MDLFSSLDTGSVQMEVRGILLSFLAAFAMSNVVALAYIWSHRGLSYSRSFIETLVMAGVATSMMMMAISNNLVWGIGMVGALAMARFRTNLRDPRDLIFLFVSLLTGIAAGTRAYMIGALGVTMFCFTVLYLSRAGFGVKRSFDALLRFTLPSGEPERRAVDECLRAHCASSVLTMLQQVAQGEGSEQVYQVRFRRRDGRDGLVRDLERVPGLENLSLLLEEPQAEI